MYTAVDNFKKMQRITQEDWKYQYFLFLNVKNKNYDHLYCDVCGQD